MTNPWLRIPLADYEGHMSLPEVAQAQLLSDAFATALERYRPRSVVLIGCAGGNGFEHVVPEVTRRVVGIDINPLYIEQARSRHARRLSGLELFVGDLQTELFAFEPVELAFAGLIFEYVATREALTRIAAMLCPGGRLVSVLQSPSQAVAEVTPSRFERLQALSTIMRLVPPAELITTAAELGLRLADEQHRESAGGKQFHVATFRVPG